MVEDPFLSPYYKSGGHAACTELLYRVWPCITDRRRKGARACVLQTRVLQTTKGSTGVYYSLARIRVVATPRELQTEYRIRAHGVALYYRRGKGAFEAPSSFGRPGDGDGEWCVRVSHDSIGTR